jgi:hypothetical protein
MLSFGFPKNRVIEIVSKLDKHYDIEELQMNDLIKVIDEYSQIYENKFKSNYNSTELNNNSNSTDINNNINADTTISIVDSICKISAEIENESTDKNNSPKGNEQGDKLNK